MRPGSPLSKAQVRILLNREKICWFATASLDAKPHVVPIYFNYIKGCVCIIFVSGESKSVKNLRSNPNSCVGINVGEKKGEIQCVLIYGKGEVKEDINCLKKAHLDILYPKYQRSKNKVEELIEKLVTSGAMKKRALAVLKPTKTIAWKI